MKTKKAALFLLTVSFLCMSLSAIERKKPLPIPMKELSNPKSPSYVPVPYPTSEADILKDVMYYLK